ncbi:hypothetical protein ACL6C3_03870 [Capilliphycus salinus ALCB114379]|uniref:hypothetical protein n=1 Tax=Capilliphycus salinus TaxID=2768948 RepID=UPI0039A47D0B
MGLTSKFLSGVMAVSALSTVWATQAIAQVEVEVPPRTTFNPVADEFNRAASNSSADIFRAQSLLGQVQFIFGVGFPWPNGSIGAFPEQALARDTRGLILLYRDAFLKQYSSDPVIRVIDLPNPYNSSILTQPIYTEFNRPAVPFNGQPLP